MTEMLSQLLLLLENADVLRALRFHDRVLQLFQGTQCLRTTFPFPHILQHRHTAADLRDRENP